MHPERKQGHVSLCVSGWRSTSKASAPDWWWGLEGRELEVDERKMEVCWGRWMGGNNSVRWADSLKKNEKKLFYRSFLSELKQGPSLSSFCSYYIWSCYILYSSDDLNIQLWCNSIVVGFKEKQIKVINQMSVGGKRKIMKAFHTCHQRPSLIRLSCFHDHS